MVKKGQTVLQVLVSADPIIAVPCLSLHVKNLEVADITAYVRGHIDEAFEFVSTTSNMWEDSSAFLRSTYDDMGE